MKVIERAEVKKDITKIEQLTALDASMLYDLYGGLLTDKKRAVMELYHEENLSLGEIAEEQGISRAAVFDALKSAEKNLIEYENKLGLLADHRNRQELVSKLRKKLQSKNAGETPDKGIESLLHELEK